MSLDLPSNLENLKEEGAEPIYDPPYESNQAEKAAAPKAAGEVHDYTETEEVRETGLPDVKSLEHPVNLEVPPRSGDETTGFASEEGIEMGHGTVGAEEFRDGE